MSESIALWLKQTDVAQFVIESYWMWPVMETLHFIGLALVIGIAGLFDLRLMGFMRRVPVTAVMQMRPWAAVGVAINVVTGVLFFVSAPDQYMWNTAWWGKVFFLVVAFANIAWFETTQGARMLALPADAPVPRTFVVAGVVSMVSWMAVLYFGRMLPFIGNAF
jgi:hypothetical protein